MKRQRHIEDALEGDAEQQHTSARKGKKTAPATSADAAPSKKRSSTSKAKPQADDDTAKDQAGATESGKQEEQAEQQQQPGEEEGTDEKLHKQAKKATEAAAGSSKPSSLPEDTIEQGRIFFLYKPTVQTEQVSGLKDVQRFFMLLQPQEPSGGSCRLIVVGKKKLPNPAKHERYFAFVDATAATPKELTEGLTAATYETKTRGQRNQGPARAAGEGSYVVAKGGSKGGVHLGYVLELPAQPGQAQQVLGIKQQGSFVLSAKNPDNKGRGAPSAGPEPAYSEQQREQFGGRAWIGVEDRSLLDVAGTELLLVGAKDDPIGTGELGAASDVLQQALDEEGEQLQGMGQQQQEQQLQEALEPAKGDAAGGDAPIPVGPAVTGELK